MLIGVSPVPGPDVSGSGPDGSKSWLRQGCGVTGGGCERLLGEDVCVGLGSRRKPAPASTSIPKFWMMAALAASSESPRNWTKPVSCQGVWPPSDKERSDARASEGMARSRSPPSLANCSGIAMSTSLLPVDAQTSSTLSVKPPCIGGTDCCPRHTRMVPQVERCNAV